MKTHHLLHPLRRAKPILTGLTLAIAVGCGPQEAHDHDTMQPMAADASADESAGFGTNFLAATVSGKVIRPASNTSLCLRTRDNRSDNGTAVVLGSCDNSSKQIWLRPDGSLRTSDNKCIDVVDGKNENGTKLQIWDCADNNGNQRFQIAQKAIQWGQTGKCFDVTDGNVNAGTAIQIWSCDGGNKNQQWSLKTVDGDAPSVATDQINTAAPSSGDTSGYLRTRGTQIVDKNNKPVLLQGTNIGGWLVTEGWMNGYTDNSDKDPYRFSLETLERRFGTSKAKELMTVWYDKFITTRDLDNLKSYGINTLRVPFGYRNLQNADTSWIKDSSGNIDFTRLDWIVNEAAKRGMYTILDFHIWDSQKDAYSQISENTDAGHRSLDKARAIWTEVAKHYRGNNSIAAYDVINEPTGSWGNLLQIGLYDAVRAVDKDRIIMMESIGTDPKQYNWQNVVYSIHQYNMKGSDAGANRSAFYSDLGGTIQNFKNLNIPTYIGEFMTQKEGDFLGWLLGQYNAQGLHWTSWTYKTVNMGAWGLCNLPSSARVDILNDSFDSIKNKWQNMGDCSPEQDVVNAFKKALGR